MQQKISLFRFLLCSVLLAAGLSGCRPRPAGRAPAAPPRQGMELRIACPTEATASLLRSRVQSWAQRQGVKIALSLYDSSPEAERAAMPADVWILSPTDLPRWAAAGRLAPLPDAYKAADNPLSWSDLLPTWREQLVQWDGQTYALPLVGEAPLCCYRADLFGAPAHRAALRNLCGRDLDGPATWEQFARLAEYFRDHGINGRPGPSLPPLPRADADLDRLFCTVAAGFVRRAVPTGAEQRADAENDLFSFHYDVRSGQPRLAAPGFVHALKLLQRLQACRPATPTDQPHPEEAFRDGRAVLCLTDAPWIKTFQKTPALHDKVGVCSVPGGDCFFDYGTGKRRPAPDGNRVPYLGGSGWLAAVSRDSPHADAAFDLLADLAGPKTSAQIFLSAAAAGGPTRTEQLYRARWDAFDLDDKQERRLRAALQETLWHSHLKNPVLCLRTPRQAAHRTLLVHGLRQALLKGADAEQTLRNVAEAWRRLDREQGLEEHVADYRRSLGLLAKE